MTQLNGNHTNGNGNGNGNGKALSRDTQVLTSPKPKPKQPNNDFNFDNFEQSVVLRQSPIWSRTIMITLMGLACFGIIWACLAKIEQVVPATGQLKPEGTVKDVQAPINGVVKSVYVKDGQEVKTGDLLLTFDSIATLAELNSLNKIRVALIQENNIYRRLMGASTGIDSEIEFLRSRLPGESAFLLKSRASLVADNNLLRSQLRNLPGTAGIGIDEKQLLDVARTELASRSKAADLEVEKTRKQLSQTKFRLQDTRNGLAIQSQILASLKTLAEEGGISKLQYLNQQQQVQTLQAEISQLQEEIKRLQFDIDKRKEESINTVASSDKGILEKIGNNKQRIADIDSQFMKIILDNEQRLADINSKISQTQLNVKYQELRAPVAGVVFDLQAKNAGFVANTTQKLLQIVPKENLTAEVFITNKDIGFVKKDMNVDVRIDSFPFSQFGDIKGKVIDIGSDALPPDQNYQFYRFPARIKLDSQYLNLVNQDQKISLQSGMSITANIKVREERTVMSLFTEMFTKQIESLNEVR
ncbi:HlyD family efflux transporter periplasmic adaptor subunit [Anabaena sp. UHCC 0204]|uniref:HlyD family efflux transporter periplasmic adaptor subunit n=1 Tax=Anabaena sp. UHCC 0204 TaxID=2590009 RepID=UPI0014463A7F|nr:HlyD family efflux transporter periplasmic adaptor subunit [Anabaena sp. UHCC 0204]MTJ10145.1 HlyD family efflux transporter periplasmic adaptor subunit [Anabaena sp. UHCC 0204]